MEHSIAGIKYEQYTLTNITGRAGTYGEIIRTKLIKKKTDETIRLNLYGSIKNISLNKEKTFTIFLPVL